MAKVVLKLKENDKATFFSPSDVWCPPAPSSTKPQERKCVEDSGASMHMLNGKDLKLAEQETVRVSTAKCKQMRKQQCTSTTWIYSGTVQIFEDAPAVLSLGKTLRRPRISP